MNALVANSQAEQQGPRPVTPELIAALELAHEHWDDLTPVQRRNAFRVMCEHIPENLRGTALNGLRAIAFNALNGMATNTAH